MSNLNFLATLIDYEVEDIDPTPWTLTKLLIVFGHIALSFILAWVTAHYIFPKWASDWSSRAVNLTIAWAFILAIIRWKLPSL